MFDLYFLILPGSTVACLSITFNSGRSFDLYGPFSTDLNFLSFSEFDTLLASPNLSTAVDISTGIDYSLLEAV